MSDEEHELGKASLELTADTTGLDRGQAAVDRMDEALQAMAAFCRIAEDALRAVKMTGAQAAESDTSAESILEGVKGISREAREAARELDKVKITTAQAAESETAGDVIDEKLKSINRNANETRRSLDRVKIAGGVPGRSGVGVGPFGSGFGRVGLLGAAIGGGVLTAPAAAPGAAGLLAAIPTLAAGGVGALGTLALAFDGVGKAIGGDKKAFDNLGPSAQQLVLTVRSLSGWFDKLRETAGANLFPGLTAGLKSALSPGTVGAITKAVTEFGQAIGQAGAAWGRYFGSAEFQSIFGPLMKAGAQNLKIMSNAALSLFDAIGVLGRAAIPLTTWITQSIADGAKLVDNWLHAKDASGQLAGAMGEAKSSLQLVWGLLKSVLNAVGALGKALYPVSKIAVKDLTDGLNALAGIIQRNQQGIRNIVEGALSAFVAIVKGAAPIVKTLAAALSAVAHAIGGWKTAFEALFAIGLAAKLGAFSKSILGIGTAFTTAAAETTAAATVIEADTAAIGASATVARGEVNGLRASLLALGGADVLAVLAGVALAAYELQKKLAQLHIGSGSEDAWNFVHHPLRVLQGKQAGDVVANLNGGIFVAPAGSDEAKLLAQVVDGEKTLTKAQEKKFVDDGNFFKSMTDYRKRSSDYGRKDTTYLKQGLAVSQTSGARSGKDLGSRNSSAGFSTDIDLTLPADLQRAITAAEAGHGNIDKANKAAYDYYEGLLKQYPDDRQAIYQAEQPYAPPSVFGTPPPFKVPAQTGLTAAQRSKLQNQLVTLDEKIVKATPLFTGEGPSQYAAAYAHNAPFAKKSSSNYQTKLTAKQETEFRAWVKKNHVPFDPDATEVDYDMRGYWLAMEAGKAPKWKGGKTHFPDTFKTPYDTRFSAESKYATPSNPFVWKGDNLVDKRSGQLVYGKSPDAAKLRQQAAAIRAKLGGTTGGVPLLPSVLTDAVSKNKSLAQALGNKGSKAQQYLQSEETELEQEVAFLKGSKAGASAKLKAALITAITAAQNRIRTVHTQLRKAITSNRAAQLQFAVDQAKDAVASAKKGTAAYATAIKGEEAALRSQIKYLDARAKNSKLSLAERTKAIKAETADKKTLAGLLKQSVGDPGSVAANEAQFLASYKAIIGSYAPNTTPAAPSSGASETHLHSIKNELRRQTPLLKQAVDRAKFPMTVHSLVSAGAVGA